MKRAQPAKDIHYASYEAAFSELNPTIAAIPHTPLHFLPMGLVGWPRLLLNYSSFISRHLAWHTPRHPTRP